MAQKKFCPVWKRRWKASRSVTNSAVTLDPEDAYGDYDEEDIEEIDRDDIPNVSELEVGMVVEVEDEDGYAYMAQVREIGEKVVVLDFNPPLAGKTLTYDVEVLAVREATEEEIEHGHVSRRLVG